MSPTPATRSKTNAGHFFEDFSVGQTLVHATPRTVTAGDVALYNALYGSRFAVQSSNDFARAIGYPAAPVDDLLVFHIVFGKSVPDISLNAVANLGYAECRFLRAVYPGESLTAQSNVIGVKENSTRETGVVYVRTTGRNATGDVILSYVRWVMVRKRDKASPAPATVVPKFADRVAPEDLGAAVPRLDGARYNWALSGSRDRLGDYGVGERIDHVAGITIEEAEHQLATRLYQNTAKVHFDAFAAKETSIGRRLIYGGVPISLARALSFNGLANAFHIAAINGGRHVAPLFAGETVYAWSEVLEVAGIPGRRDVGAVRLRTVATRNQSCAAFPGSGQGSGLAPQPDPAVILDLDYWAVLPC